MNKLTIHLLGDFVVSHENQQIAFTDNRSRKVWLILAYFLCHKGYSFSREDLINLFWSDEQSVNNPENALKTTFHRVRALLDQLYPSAGKELITWVKGNYGWNTDIKTEVDAEEFDRLCREEYEDEDARLEGYMKALALYKGDFLNSLASEAWVVPMATYYHQLYINTVIETNTLLTSRRKYKEAADICRAALKIEPYFEPLHQMLMQALINLGDHHGAALVYEELSNQLFSDLGIKPSKELRDLYRSATQLMNYHSIAMDDVIEFLKEDENDGGALYCEYDYFKILCHLEARSMKRNGKSTHIALFSISEAVGKPLSKRSLNTSMEHLQEEIGSNLRRGDTYARCSVSQYVVMLPQANYENSCMVAQRIIRSFFRQHPHSPAKIQFSVQPLTPES
ncbi:MAG: hypothetical protein IKU80_06025 [Firmicutes bacterium]|nr:hypothetical protein [Bacillota bacterium]